MWSWKWTVGMLLSCSRYSFPREALLRYSAFCSCTPKKDPKFLYFFITATTFLAVLTRPSHPKAQVTHFRRSHSLLLVWLESLVSWNGPRARQWDGCHSVTQKHLITRFRYPWTKWKSCCFVKVTVTPSFLNQINGVFY